MQSILQKQCEQLAAERYPLHMPGHKRRQPPAPGLSCYAFDLTEIDGADDLHDADGILAQAMGRTAALYGSARCWYLVGGSTVGLLAGIRAVAPFGSEVIVARGCHKAVYHALELGHLTAHYVTAPVVEAFGVYGSIPPAAVEAALAAHPRARCVILTSPTYEGVQSDVAAMAALCHARGVPLLVDEAHGAHYLPFAEPLGWRGGAVAAGADLVVQSAHKTLPSLTQTAWLHRNGTLVDPAAVDRQLDVFETSSPSYPLLVSLDGCTGWLRENGPAAFAAWRARLDRFAAAARRWHNTPVLGLGPERRDFFAFDDGKILLRIGAAGAAQLRAAGFEPEMVCGPNVLAMTSPCDDGDALDRLAAWLGERDAAAPPPPRAGALLPAPGPARCTIAEALDRPAATMPLAEAVGKTAAEYVWAYPPGVPLVAPGEQVTDAFVEAAGALTAAGTTLHHSGGGGAGRLAVLA
ncbi:ornithine decarboxylase [uncultured Subdoligranulum sp.]|uniref:aminotransferase class I/II-fold pyridoxal phosphate-dependent enzyme n=1 Tax=uncultured Subdoligranulum sp. TaxID=512298 RepID=UPI0025E7E342|nr:ornithine decarboxylase [uncultured Subdoligranulum sp.]